MPATDLTVDIRNLTTVNPIIFRISYILRKKGLVETSKKFIKETAKVNSYSSLIEISQKYVYLRM